MPYSSSYQNALAPHTHSHNQSHCNNQQHHLVATSVSVPPPGAQSSKIACNASLYSPSVSNVLCSNQCGQPTTQSSSTYHQQSQHPYMQHYYSSIPHSKSLEHYHENPKMDHHTSRHSFDQPFNYQDYDCTDGMMSSDRSNGYHHTRNTGIYHQPNCSLQNNEHLYNVSGNRYPLPANFAEHHYSLRNYDRLENFPTTINSQASCCYNPHYECLNNFNGRSGMPKLMSGIEYSNMNFPPK